MNQKNITDQLRNRFTADLAEFLAAKYDVDVCQTAAGTLMIPAVDGAGEDRWVKFGVIIPKDANEAEGTDGYSLAQEYQLKLDAISAVGVTREGTPTGISAAFIGGWDGDRPVVEETEIFLQNINSPGTVFRTNHASNYVVLAGTFNEDIPRLLKQLADAKEKGRYRMEAWRRRL